MIMWTSPTWSRWIIIIIIITLILIIIIIIIIITLILMIIIIIIIIIIMLSSHFQLVAGCCDDIKKGEQVFMDYGDKYWDGQEDEVRVIDYEPDGHIVVYESSGPEYRSNTIVASDMKK